ncbi:unnamed protein product [Caenorhabditis bovis]|uniref:Uncharacterized protein n=1 Tax=Caenorhabditis bovis TaxID=2654633 RepID=A0A8S1FDD0_9PELO|nr:unnamed protein product [Caenorhabditis bovis]
MEKLVEKHHMEAANAGQYSLNNGIHSKNNDSCDDANYKIKEEKINRKNEEKNEDNIKVAKNLESISEDGCENEVHKEDVEGNMNSDDEKLEVDLKKIGFDAGNMQSDVFMISKVEIDIRYGNDELSVEQNEAALNLEDQSIESGESELIGIRSPQEDEPPVANTDEAEYNELRNYVEDVESDLTWALNEAHLIDNGVCPPRDEARRR